MTAVSHEMPGAERWGGRGLAFLRSVLAVVLAVLSANAAQPGRRPRMDVFGNYHTLGVMVTCAAEDDPGRRATATVEYRPRGAPSFRTGFPLTRVDATRFIGSVFWLRPDTEHDIRVTLRSAERGPLHGATVEAVGRTRPEPRILDIPGPAGPGRAHYVNPRAPEGGDGSAARPFHAVREALDRAMPGDQVVLRAGVYRESKVAFPRSGRPDALIVVRGFPGEEAVFEGGCAERLDWTPVPDRPGLHVAPLDARLALTHLVLVDGERLYRYPTQDDLAGLTVKERKLTVGLPGYRIEGEQLYLNLKGKDPVAAKIILSDRVFAFDVSRDWVCLADLTFRHFGMLDATGEWQSGAATDNMMPGAAIRIRGTADGGNDCLVHGCRFAVNDLGIRVGGRADRLTIQDNEFHDVIFGWPWQAVKAGQGLETGGVRVYSPYTGQGLVIRRNRFRGFFDGLCVCPFNHGPFNTLGRTNETDVYENDVSNCRDDGIETDGQCANVRIWSNRFRECYQGISLSPVLTGPVYCIRNVAWGRVNHRLFKIGWNGHRGAMYLFHNTSHTATGLMAAGKTVTWDLLFARNNAWHSLGGATAWGFALNVDADLPGHPVDLDYDNFARQWAVDNGSDVLGVWQGEPASLRVVQEKARQYLHGRNAFPGFVNAETGDFALRPDSPLVDAGIHVPGINDDFAGAAPDIGAVESGVARRE